MKDGTAAWRAFEKYEDEVANTRRTDTADVDVLSAGAAEWLAFEAKAKAEVEGKARWNTFEEQEVG